MNQNEVSLKELKNSSICVEYSKFYQWKIDILNIISTLDPDYIFEYEFPDKLQNYPDLEFTTTTITKCGLICKTYRGNSMKEFYKILDTNSKNIILHSIRKFKYETAEEFLQKIGYTIKYAEKTLIDKNDSE